MTKKYGIILFCFFITTNINIIALIAQLPNDIAYFTQTLQNIVLMLTHVVPPPLRPPGESIITIPTTSNEVTLPNGKKLKGPSGTKITISDEQITIEVPAAGGKLEIPDMNVRTDIKVLSDSRVKAAGGIDRELLAGQSISISAGPATVTPTVIPPPIKPSTGTGTGTGGAGTGGTPPPSIPFVDLRTAGAVSMGRPVVTISASGGNVTLPPFGGLVGSTVDSYITLPDGMVVAVPANKYINIDEEGVVIVQPKGAIPPPLIPPSGTGKPIVTPPPHVSPINIPVSSSGEAETSIGKIFVSKDTKVTELPGIAGKEKSVEIKVPVTSSGSVQLPSKKTITAPAGSTIELTTKENIVKIPVVTKEEKVTVPANTTIIASNPVTLKFSDNKKENLAPGIAKVIPGRGTVIILPQEVPGKPAVVPPPLIPPVLEPRKPEDILKTVGNVTQLKAPAGITNAQALSGYVAVYYALSELSRAENKRDLAITFNQFMEPTALRSIKKRRIQVACKHYIANILTKPPYLVPENLSPELKTPGFGLQFKQVRSIYHSLLTDLAGEIAATYVQTNYTNSATTDQDSLKPSTFILQGKILISDFKNFVDKRRTYYAAQFKVSAAALSALIDQPEYLASYARINNDTKIEFDARHVLTELRKPNVFGLEEGPLNPNFFDNSGLLKKEYITQAMPKGIWLHEGDIAHLVRDPIILKVVSLSDTIKDMITIFNDLSLLSVDQMRIFNAGEEMQGKYFINSQILERVAKEEKNKIHIFIVNVGFYFGGSNRPNEYRWVTIARSSEGKYLLVDATNVDRTKDVNLEIIKQEIAKF